MKSKLHFQSSILFVLACLPLYSCGDKEEISLTPEMEIISKLLSTNCAVSALDNSKKRVNLNSIMKSSDEGLIIHKISSGPSQIYDGNDYVNSINYTLEVLKVDFLGFSETLVSEDSHPLFDLDIRFPESECNIPDYTFFEPMNNVLVTFEEDFIHIELLDESLVVKPSQDNQLLEYEPIAQALKDAFEENIITISVSDFPDQLKSRFDFGTGYDKLSFQGKSSQPRTAGLTVGISTLRSE